jgi:hypothetical protein
MCARSWMWAWGSWGSWGSLRCGRLRLGLDKSRVCPRTRAIVSSRSMLRECVGRVEYSILYTEWTLVERSRDVSVVDIRLHRQEQSEIGV